MKKILISILIIFSSLFFVGCQNENIIKLGEHIIERRDCLFLATDENYLAMLYSGQREEPYALDGVVNQLVPFGIIIFGANDINELTENEYAYTLTINEETFEGNLELNELDHQYYVDIEKEVPKDATVTLKVNIGNQIFEQQLNNISNDFKVSQNDAIKIASNELENSLKKIAESTDKTEVLIKILKDFSSTPDQKFYWYIAIIGEDGQTAGILIDTQTAEIISKK